MSKDPHIKKYKIKVGNVKPPAEVLQKHKSFPSLLDNYQLIAKDLHRRPLYKDPKAFLFVFLAAVIVWLVYNAFQEDKQLENNPPKEEKVGMMWEQPAPQKVNSDVIHRFEG